MVLVTAVAAALQIWPARRRGSQLSLSLFEPHAGGCAWSRLDIESQRTEMIARFPADCQGVEVAWDLSGKEALVWFAPDGDAPQDVMLYRVDVAKGKPERLPLPELGETERYLFDRQGRVIAFTIDQQVILAADSSGALEFQGHTYQASTYQGGTDALVHALTLGDDGAWHLLETHASRCCESGAPGISTLLLYTKLRQDEDLWLRQSEAQLSTTERYPTIRSERLKDALRARLPQDLATEDAAGPWLAMTRAGWQQALIFRGLGKGGTRATGLAMFAHIDEAKPVPALSFAATDVVRLMSENHLLLITEWATGASPHLYDMRTGTLIYQSTVATGVVFWPPSIAHGRSG